MTRERKNREPAQVAGVNEIRLVGTMPVLAEERVLPSGDTLQVFRVAVQREVRLGGGGGRRQVDSLECVAWDARVKRSVGAWRVGDTVEVNGALHRRFFRTATGTGSRVEVEVRAGRIIRRAAT